MWEYIGKVDFGIHFSYNKEMSGRVGRVGRVAHKVAGASDWRRYGGLYGFLVFEREAPLQLLVLTLKLPSI